MKNPNSQKREQKKQKVKENLERRHAFGTGSEAAGTGRFCESDEVIQKVMKMGF